MEFIKRMQAVEEEKIMDDKGHLFQKNLREVEK